MKTKILIALAFVGLSIAPLVAQDTNQPPVPTSSFAFAETVKSYFTTFNPELESTFLEARGEFAIGVDALQDTKNAPLVNSLRLSYDVYKSLSGEVLVRDSGITGFLVSAQAGLGLNFVVHDAKLTLYGHVGHRQDEASASPEKIFGEGGVRIEKALTKHTFAGVAMGIQFPGNSRSFSAFTGFTF